MLCPYCDLPNSKKLETPTALGYQRFRCNSCERSFNERTGTPFNFLQFPTDVVMLVVLVSFRGACVLYPFEDKHVTLADFKTDLIL